VGWNLGSYGSDYEGSSVLKNNKIKRQPDVFEECTASIFMVEE
jgi:hypothetical protein